MTDAVDIVLSHPNNSIEGNFNLHSIWELCEVVKYLQSDPTADQERLVWLEWQLLPLARHNDFEPKILHAELSQNPNFFVEVLAALFRPKNEPKDEQKESDPAKVAQAEAAYRLFDSWTGIPGKKSDGTIDDKMLMNWVSEARRQCLANGRIEVCDLQIGEQLSYAPADPDGSWPCAAVREVFENVATDELLRGFDMGVHNQRGVTSRGMNDGGEQERNLAKKYRNYSESCKISSPRTALGLRRIAEHYEAQAKWHDERTLESRS